MYLGNENLRSADEKLEYTEEQLMEMLACSEDILYFAKNFYYIIHLIKGKILFEPYEFQEKLLRLMSGDDIVDNKYSLICISSRQSGKTTTTACGALWYVLFNKNKTVYILANKEESAIEILDRIKMAYEMLPCWMQPGIGEGGYNKKSIHLANGSKIRVSATSPSAIRGRSINWLLIDETAFIADGVSEEFDKSVFPTISSVNKPEERKDAKIILISTPKGVNSFHTKWKKAISGKSSFTPFEVKWTDVPGRDENFKKKIIDDFGLQYWNQEYACIGGDMMLDVRIDGKTCLINAEALYELLES